MTNKRSNRIHAIVFLLGILCATGSAGDPVSEAGKIGAIGAFTGAASGAIMGSVVGHPIAGAAIGGGLGLSAGVVFGGQFKRSAFRSSPALSGSGMEPNGTRRQQFFTYPP